MNDTTIKLNAKFGLVILTIAEKIYPDQGVGVRASIQLLHYLPT